MNHITNDFGVDVIAVGAPGSIARMRCQWPSLLNSINAMFFDEGPGRNIDDALEAIKYVGVPKEDWNAVLIASYYGTEGPGTVTELVLRVGGYTGPMPARGRDE